jgi:segregation and condensation protein A
MSFAIKLPLFEGPFDLLLFFIERDELDIYDIPIAKITRDFLAYIHQLEQMNIEVASEFILVAATLMRIKAKMLLPRPQKDATGAEIDPRDELIKHLLEYKKYKSVIGILAEMEERRLAMQTRGNAVSEIKKIAEIADKEAELEDLDLYKLLSAYQKVMKRLEEEQNKPIHQINPYPFTIEGQKTNIKILLTNQKVLSFEEIIAENPSKIAVVFNFLAILEMLQLAEIRLIYTDEEARYNNFVIATIQETELTVQD